MPSAPKKSPLRATARRTPAGTDPPVPGRGAPGVLLWSVRGLALAAAGLSAFLLWQGLRQGPIAGCGTGGCEDALTLRWSRWLGVPVSAMGLGTYVLILVASVWAGASRAGRRRAAWAVLLAASVLAAGAGAWFLVVQFGVLGEICPYCTAAHACGIVLLMLVEWGLWQQRHAGHPRLGPKLAGAMVLLGLAGVGALAAGQLARPQLGQPPGYRIEALAKPVEIARGDLPVLGPPDAPHIVYILGDYTCRHCRVAHGYLDQARRRYGDRIAVAVLPVPLNPDCNPAFHTHLTAHFYACEINRLALAVFRADPAAFPKMDAWLFEPETSRLPGEAEAYAAGLVGDAALSRARADPWVAQAIARDVELYKELGADAVPKVLIGKQKFKGQPENAKVYFDAIEAEFNLSPRPGG